MYTNSSSEIGENIARRRGFLNAADTMNNLTARRLEQLNTEHRWLFDVSRPTLHRLGFDIVNGTLGIIPIDIEDHMKYLGLRYEPYMVHFGFYSSKAILSRIVLMTPPKPLII